MINEFFEDGTVGNACTKDCRQALEKMECPAVTGEHYCPFFAGALRVIITDGLDKQPATTVKKFPDPEGLDFEIDNMGNHKIGESLDDD
jgi:hypothetical protein